MAGKHLDSLKYIICFALRSEGAEAVTSEGQVLLRDVQHLVRMGAVAPPSGKFFHIIL